MQRSTDDVYPFSHPNWDQDKGFRKERPVETRFLPVGSQLAVSPDPPVSLLAEDSPMVLPDNVVSDRPVSGVVLRLGTHVDPAEFQVGRRVIFDSRSGLEWTEDGESLLLIGTHEILAHCAGDLDAPF